MDTKSQLTARMRAILIDWLVEVQENFELYHETLYLGVRIVDLYLQAKETDKQKLQLVGATAMLIAAKIEVFLCYLEEFSCFNAILMYMWVQNVWSLFKKGWGYFIDP